MMFFTTFVKDGETSARSSSNKVLQTDKMNKARSRPLSSNCSFFRMFSWLGRMLVGVQPFLGDHALVDGAA